MKEPVTRYSPVGAVFDTCRLGQGGRREVGHQVGMREGGGGGGVEPGGRAHEDVCVWWWGGSYVYVVVAFVYVSVVVVCMCVCKVFQGGGSTTPASRQWS